MKGLIYNKKFKTKKKHKITNMNLIKMRGKVLMTPVLIL